MTLCRILADWTYSQTPCVCALQKTTTIQQSFMLLDYETDNCK